MYNVFIKLLVGAAILQLGLSIGKFGECTSRECLDHVESSARQVIKIRWRPISVFPEEAKRFLEAK